MGRPPFNRVLTRKALLDGREDWSQCPGTRGTDMWEMPPVSEQSCLRKSVKKKLATALCLMLPSLVPQMNASQLRKWMSRGGRTSPMSTCAGWRKPSGEQSDRLFLVSLSHPAHPRHLPPKQIQKDKSPFYGKGKVEIAYFFFFLSDYFLEQF